MRHTYLKYALGAVMQLAVLCSCSEVGELLSDVPQHEQGGPSDDGESGVVEVLLSLPPLSTATRTSIDIDGGDAKDSELTAKWADGDSFGLLIRSSSDGDVPYNIADTPAVTEPYRFNHYADSHDVNDCVFAGLVPNMVGGSTYNYYAVYPYSSIVSVDGTSVRCTVPTVQSGRYDDGSDLMLAWAKGYNKLSQTIYNNLDFNFKHLTHALKITVPESLNRFGSQIERILIEFPQPVAGDVVLNVTDGSLDKSTLKSNRVEIRFDADHPFVVDEPFWVYIAPCDLTDMTVRFTAFNDTESLMSDYVQTTALESLLPQRITPVQLGVTRGFSVTWFNYTVDWSQLGEPVETLTVSLPDGYEFADGGSEKVMSAFEGMYSFALRDEALDALDGRSIATTYESEHAIIADVRTPLTISDYERHSRNEKVALCPYLFEEDFSEVGFINSDDTHKNSNEGSKDPKAFLNGWTGARIGAQANTAIRIACYRSNVLWFEGAYPARVDSAPISNLKDGAEVTISLVFDYGMNEQKSSNSASWVNQTCYIGRVEDPQGFKSDATDGTFDNKNSFTLNEQNADYTNLPYKDQRFILSGCTGASRITMRTVPSAGSGNSNNTCWLYIDNVRVSIVQE